MRDHIDPIDEAEGPDADAADTDVDLTDIDLVDTDDPATEPQSTASRVRELARAITTWVASGILIIVLGIAVLAIALPAATGSTALTVLTSSMEPHLPPGTMVVVRPTDFADIQPGMVVTYQLKSGEPTLITHRVTERVVSTSGETTLITQGDNNPQPDPDPVREVQVRGTVWYAIPYIGWVAMLFTGDVRAIVITVVVVALLGYALWAFGSAIFGRKKSA